MPRYRLKRSVYIALGPGQPPQLLPAGAEIEFGGVPGSALDPLDEAAEKAVKERASKPKGLLPVDGRREVPRPDPSTIEIPDGWLDLRPEQIVNLSRRLGAARNNTYTQAIAWIENELKRRAPHKTSTENDDGNG